MTVKISRWLLPVLLLTAIAGTGPALARTDASATIAPAELVRAVDALAAEVLRDRVTPGPVIGIADHGRPLFIKGYGAANLENNTAVSAKTVFRIGSVTKQFTATAAAGRAGKVRGSQVVHMAEQRATSRPFARLAGDSE